MASAAVHFHVLIVEDNEPDVFLIQKAMEETQLPLTLHIAKDGEEAIQFFDKADIFSNMPCPSLVLLDINLPKKQGGDVLRHMRQSHKCADALVLIVSTSDSPKDREQMTNLGADGYFRKPSEYDEFMKLSDIVKGLLGDPGLLRNSSSQI